MPCGGAARPTAAHSTTMTHNTPCCFFITHPQVLEESGETLDPTHQIRNAHSGTSGVTLIVRPPPIRPRRRYQFGAAGFEAFATCRTIDPTRMPERIRC